ncbi:FAD binding domain protein [Hypoxylon sp. FL1284]|nr:FAD binding domain protein [Hypoxylon sp. FL1284]
MSSSPFPHETKIQLGPPGTISSRRRRLPPFCCREMAKSVLVVGGSLTGLMHGLQHKRLGNNVTIIEQDSGERVSQDAGIGFGDNVASFLAKYDATGLQASIPNHARRIAYYQRPDVYRIMKPLALTSWGYLYRLLRANFDGHASAACRDPPAALPGDGSATFLAGKKVVGLDVSSSEVTVRFVDVATNKEESLSADLLIGADGLRSTVRKLVGAPTRERYAGYVAWRGSVKESLVSKETFEYFSDWLCLNITKRSYLVGYAIPTDGGNFTPGERLITFLWYRNLADDSAEMRETFTDTNGAYHQTTVPRGLLRPEVWARVLAAAKTEATAPFAEVIGAARAPFVTKIGDAFSGAASFHGGRVVVVGDAFASFRPHAAAAAEQGALHARLLEDVYRGDATLDDWEREARVYARQMALLNRVIGDFCRGAVFPFLSAFFSYVGFLLWQKVRRR